jgi:thiamine biosynthesis lipoprotein
MGISLGGIAKGYAVDIAVKTLSENGIKSALVDAGGDIRVIGNRPDGTPWQIGLGDPKSAKKITSVIGITDLAVATSGTYRRGIEDIIDPHTGEAAPYVMRSTVIARDAIDADALATSIYVMGPRKGMDLTEGLDGIAALIVTKDGVAIESSRWKSLVRLNNCR